MRLCHLQLKTALLFTISGFLLLLTQFGCREVVPESKPKPPVIQFDYVLTLDPINWLWQISTNQTDPEFTAMLEAAATKELDPSIHPLSTLSDSISRDEFKRWFGDLTIMEKTMAPKNVLQAEFHVAILKLKQLLIKRLNTDQTELVSIEANKLDQLSLRIRTIEPAEVSAILFSPKSQVGFYETYNYAEVSPFLEQLRHLYQGEEDILQPKDFLDLLEGYELGGHPSQTLPTLNDDHPVVGYVARNNIPLVDSLLQSPAAKAVIPKDLQFAWNKYPVEESPDLFPLLALKTNAYGKPRVSGTNIRYARQDFEPYSEMPMVSTEFDEDGTAEWRRMTRTNVGRNVAIVVDGLVYTYPTIQQEISGGRAQITGQFSIEEAQELSASIRAGSFPATIYVFSQDSTVEQR